MSATVLAIAINGSDVYVGGTFTNAGTTVVRGIAKWDGANWSGLGSGATNGTSTAEVRALAFAGDRKLYFCGRFPHMSGVTPSSTPPWGGAKLDELGSGIFTKSPLQPALAL